MELRAANATPAGYGSPAFVTLVLPIRFATHRETIPRCICSNPARTSRGDRAANNLYRDDADHTLARHARAPCVARGVRGVRAG